MQVGNVLLLSQHDNEVGRKAISQALFGLVEPKIGYIASQPDPQRVYFSACQKIYRELGFVMDTYLELEDSFDEETVERILKCDTIHLSGGDTFRCLKNLKERKLIDKLQHFNHNGGVLIGVSAGAMILTPNIDSAYLCGDINEVGLSDLSATNIVGFSFAPHFNKHIEAPEFMSNEIKNRYLCSDNDALLIINNRVLCINEPIKQMSDFRE